MPSTSLQNWVNRLIYNSISKNTALCILTIILFFISYVPSPFSFFIFIAFIPFLKLLEEKKIFDSFRLGYLIGLLFNLIIYYYLAHYKSSSYILLTILNALQFGIFAVLYSVIKRYNKKFALISFPFLWTVLEYSREWGDLALNWINIGYTQANYLTLIQFIELTGVNGITFWICLINLLIYFLFFESRSKNKYLTFGLIVLFLFLIPLIFGYFKMNESVKYEGINATYIQPSIDSKQKWEKSFSEKNLRILLDLSRKSEINPNSLLIWPETAIPHVFQKTIAGKDSLFKYTQQNSINLLTGILYSESNRNYNSVILISPDTDSLQIYNKMKLVPIEEGLPFEDVLDGVLPEENLAIYYDYGKAKTVFNINCQTFSVKNNNDLWDVEEKKYGEKNIKFASVICFESSFPSFIREFVNMGAQFLVVITNDEWFGYSTQPIQHVRTSQLRAIENRMAVIHCSNAGISGFIDPYGKIYGKKELYEIGSATAVIPLNSDKTFFTENGDLVAIVCAIISVLMLAISYLRRMINLKTLHNS